MQSCRSPLFLLVLLHCALHGCDRPEPPPQPIPFAEGKPCPDPDFYPSSDSAAAIPDAAFAFLRCTPLFSDALGGMIYPTRQAIAFRTLARQPDAATLFTRLIRESATAGQLYGLAGLRYTDTALFARELPSFAERIDSVYRMTGCIRWLEPVQSVVQVEGGIRLAPGESLAAWEWKQAARRRRGNVHVPSDIYGGAIPMELMGRDMQHENEDGSIRE